MFVEKYVPFVMCDSKGVKINDKWVNVWAEDFLPFFLLLSESLHRDSDKLKNIICGNLPNQRYLCSILLLRTQNS
jgi:hypothetical protein